MSEMSKLTTASDYYDDNEIEVTIHKRDRFLFGLFNQNPQSKSFC